MSNVERIEREGAAASGMPFTFEHKLGGLKLASEAPASANLVVRKSDDSAGMEELEASIKYHGVIYPLITMNISGTEYVVAGNRRLKALRKLYGDYENKMITCVHATEFNGDMREVAMAVNIALPPHAIDQFEVFSAQVKAGLAPEEVASRHAITLRQVTQRLALAELAPEIREAWRDGKIQSDTAQAFTLAPDKAAQLKAFNSLTKQGRIYTHAVQEQFVKNREVGKGLEFVGIENYENAGGKVIRDAFDTNYHRVSDEKLLVKLYHQRMETECQRLLDDGWSFAVPVASLGNDRYGYGTLEPAKVTMTKDERKLHADLTARLEANGDDDEAAEALEELENAAKFRAFTPEHKKRSGCFVDVSDRGELLITYGRTKPAERSKAPAPTAAAKGKKADSKPKPPQMSQILKQRLDQQLLKATAAAIIASQSGKGLPGLLARVVAMQITWQRPTGIPMTVSGQLSNIRNMIEPKIMYDAIKEAFDAKDYFNSIPKDMIAAAVSESMSADHAAKVREMGKEAAAKFAVANIAPTGWLPRELRLASYRGPKGSVAKKAKRK